MSWPRAWASALTVTLGEAPTGRRRQRFLTIPVIVDPDAARSEDVCPAAQPIDVSWFSGAAGEPKDVGSRAHGLTVQRLSRIVGPVATNVHVLADASSREAIAIDTATPSLAWIVDELAARDWTLKLIVSTHGHWDHIGDNAAVAAHTGADIAVHPLDRPRLEHPQPLFAPFEIPPSVPAFELAEGGEIRFGEIRLKVLHTPGHTEGSVCLYAADEGLLFSGDTLFAGGWGRVDLPGADPDAMVESLGRLTSLEDHTGVLPGHGQTTTIGRERAWMELVRDGRRLFA